MTRQFQPGNTCALQRRGQSFTLGQQIGRGGEGTVFAVAQSSKHVAKIYHKPMPNEHCRKIETLIACTQSDLLDHGAWPIDIVTYNKHPVGYLMGNIDGGISLGELATPKSRLRYATDMSYAKLVAVAANAAAAVAAFHQAGFVIGDINGRNLLAMPDATVRVIDCDSVQVDDGKIYKCPVGTDEFLAPELFGKDLRTVRRRETHDDFSLAILIYQLLCVGRHPYAQPGVEKIADAIRQRKHTFGWLQNGGAPLQHIGLPVKAVLTPALIHLFRSAFACSIRTGSRPTAHSWTDALQRSRHTLISCQKNRLHQFHGKHCPWCAFEDSGRPAVFDRSYQRQPPDKTMFEWLRVIFGLRQSG